MHYAPHILVHCIAICCVINGGTAARSAVSPDILANFAKNVASVLSPAILGELQSRNNRSSGQSIDILTIPVKLNDDDLDSSSKLDNIVDRTSNGRKYYGSRSYPYNGLYVDSVKRFEGSETNERIDPLRDDSYLRRERPNFYRLNDFPTNSNFEDIQKSTDRNTESSIDSIEESPTNLYASYHGPGFPKAAFPHGSFLAKPGYGGFPGFGFGYGPFHGHHGHYHPYGGGPPSDSNEAQDNNGTNYRGYGQPYGDHGFHHSPFHYGGYGDPFYGPPHRNGNNSSDNGRNGHYGHYGPYHGGPDFYGPHGYGYGYGRNGNNGNYNNSRQTDEAAEDDDQYNSTKNGYPYPYGPPLIKPLLGAFHHHGFPYPFSLPPYDHFHGLFKGGPVVGVGHVGYPIYADPYPIGFPFHHPYGPFFHGKKYLPSKHKSYDSGDSGESTTAASTGELSESENPERIAVAVLNEEVAPAPSSNRYKTSARKGYKRINFDSQKI